MSERIEIEGVSLTVDEAREVLAWVAEPGGLAPECLWWAPFEPRRMVLQADDGKAVRLTPALIEQIRDAVEPWTEVRRDEVKPGEVFRIPCADGEDRIAIDAMMRSGQIADAALDGSSLGGTVSDFPCFVRRPRKEAPMTLRDVADGTVFDTLAGPRYERLGIAGAAACLIQPSTVPCLDVEAREIALLPTDIRIEIVERDQ